MKKLILASLFLILNLSVFAQSAYEVSGSVRDSSGLSIIAATVKLTSAKDSLFTRTNADGVFAFREVKSGQFTLSVTSLGFQTVNRKFLYNEGKGKLP